MHVIHYAQGDTDPLPPGFVPQSSSSGTIRGGFPLCNVCAPACPKCQMPVPTKKVRAYFEQLHKQRHSSDTPVHWGNGKCQHTWLFGRWPL
jgi:hypothetical protein